MIQDRDWNAAGHSSLLAVACREGSQRDVKRKTCRAEGRCARVDGRKREGSSPHLSGRRGVYILAAHRVSLTLGVTGKNVNIPCECSRSSQVELG